MKTVLLLITLTAGATAQTPLGKKPVPTQSVAAQIEAAETALDKGDFKNAVDLLKTLALEQPKNAQIAYDLGFAEEHVGDETAASEAYARAVTLDANMAEPLVGLGLLDARAGHTGKAHEELQAAVAISTSPSELRGRALRALAALDEPNHPDAARDELLQAVKLTGETPDDVTMSARLAAKAGDTADAEAIYRRTLASDPGDAAAASSLSALLLKDGKVEEAQTLLEKATESHPDNPELVSQLAAAYGKAGKVQQAVGLLTKTRAANPAIASNAAVTRMLARLDVMAGKDSEAATLYAELATNSPNDPVLLDEYGGALVKSARFAEAQAVFTRATSMKTAFPTPEDWAEAESHLAFAASRNHQPAIALQALNLRATVLPISAPSLFLQAISHDALHQNGDAIKAYRAFLAAAQGKFPDQEFQARHRLVALEHTK